MNLKRRLKETAYMTLLILLLVLITFMFTQIAHYKADRDRWKNYTGELSELYLNSSQLILKHALVLNELKLLIGNRTNYYKLQIANLTNTLNCTREERT